MPRSCMPYRAVGLERRIVHMTVAPQDKRMDMPASDFGGAWKEVLERFFEPFIAFFLPQVHAGIDWTQPVVFQDTALQQVAPDEPLSTDYTQLVRYGGVSVVALSGYTGNFQATI